jgi:hypothetical protein
METKDWTLTKVISGAQTGADQAALRAAKKLGIATGGWVPKGCRTEDGPRPDLIDEFGLTETETDDYVERTHLNIEHSDGTIRFAADFNSIGERCTLRGIRKYKKPYFDFDISKHYRFADLLRWVWDNNIHVLNVAGNRESKHPGIGKTVEEFLIPFFTQLIPLERAEALLRKVLEND